MVRFSACVLAMWAVICCASPLQSAIVYSGGVYTQDFNSLPTNAVNNSNIQTGGASPYVNGWQDDTTTIAGNRISIPGWYLFHNNGPFAEGGANGSQRLRFGQGNGIEPSFYFYSNPNATGTEKALGIFAGPAFGGANDPSNRQLNMGVRLTNNTFNVLTEFTLTYDGEQWRNGGGDLATFPAGAPGEVLDFQYSLGAVAINSNGYTNVNALDFTAPVATNVNGRIDGDLPGSKVLNITSTVTGLNWLPGQDLWLRWIDGNNVGDDDGLAIDNVRFSARRPLIPEPASIWLVVGGALALAATRRMRLAARK